MAKYHINPKTGSPNQCKATKGGCPFGGADNHFPSREAAAAEIERRLSSLSMPAAVSKKSTTSDKGAAKREIAALRGKIEAAQRTYTEKRKTLEAQETVRENLQDARAALVKAGADDSSEDVAAIDSMLTRSSTVIGELTAEVAQAKTEADALSKELNDLRQELAPKPTKTTQTARSTASSGGVAGCGSSRPSMSC